MRIIDIIQRCYGDNCLACEHGVNEACEHDAYYQKWLEVMIKPCLERNTLNLATFLYMLSLDVRLNSAYDSSEKTFMDMQREIIQTQNNSPEYSRLDALMWGDL